MQKFIQRLIADYNMRSKLVAFLSEHPDMEDDEGKAGAVLIYNSGQLDYIESCLTELCQDNRIRIEYADAEYKCEMEKYGPVTVKYRAASVMV